MQNHMLVHLCMCTPYLGMVASFSRALNSNSSNFELKSGQKYGHSDPKNVLKSDFQLEASCRGRPNWLNCWSVAPIYEGINYKSSIRDIKGSPQV